MKSLPAIQSDIIFSEWQGQVKQGTRLYSNPLTHQHFEWIKVEEINFRDLARRQVYDIPHTPRVIVLGQWALVQQGELTLEELTSPMNIHEMIQLLKQIAHAAKDLFQLYGTFKLTPEMVKGTKNGKVLVWHGSDYSSSEPKCPMKNKDLTKEEIIKDLVNILHEKSRSEVLKNLGSLCDLTSPPPSNLMTENQTDSSFISTMRTVRKNLNLAKQPTISRKYSFQTTQKQCPTFLKSRKSYKDLKETTKFRQVSVTQSKNYRGSVPLLKPCLKRDFIQPSTLTVQARQETPLMSQNRFSVPISQLPSGELKVKSPRTPPVARYSYESLSTAEFSRIEEAEEEINERVTESMVRRDLDKLFSRPVSPSSFQRSPQFQVLSSEMNQLLF